MAEIVPFKGILYNPEKIHDFSDVVAPPYDVISPQEQEQLHQRHPNNVIRLILGKTKESDTARNNRYTRAATYLKNWINDKILVQDTLPALYLSSVDFQIEDRSVTRFGLVALVRLEPFEKKVVLPHEKTFSKVKSERLELIKACHANFSPIFSLYSDQNSILGVLKQAVANKPPDMKMFDSNGFLQKLWKIKDKAVQNYVSEAMAEKTIFIADGHHRYETALNYRDWIAANNNEFSKDHPANFVMMSLSSMEDPGLIILPAHRILSGVDPEILNRFEKKAEPYFKITTFEFAPHESNQVREKFIAQLHSNKERNCIGMFMKNRDTFILMTLKPGVMNTLFSNEIPESLRNLDVTVLTRLIFMEILGFDQSRLDNENLITYSSREKDAIEIVRSENYDVTFILNPTKKEQVRQVAQESLIMPRKSTYFYPKVISGHVLNSLIS
ncbi:MAG: DUF1015 domain-containing protein [Desulfobacterales bacterium]